MFEEASLVEFVKRHDVVPLSIFISVSKAKAKIQKEIAGVEDCCWYDFSDQWALSGQM